jgi:NNP family nitrate/nitrite transporter-like MFS transporter
MGAGMLVNVYLVESMVAVKGVTPVAAGFMGTTMFVCSIFGGLIFGLLLKKIGKLNSTACVLAVVAGLAFLAVWFAPFSAVTYVFFGLAGLFSYGAQSIAQTRLPLLPMTGDYTPANLAAATGLSGLIMAALMIGVSTAISAIAGTNYNLVFIIAALVFAVAGLLGFTVPELGAKGKLAQSAPAPAFPPVS